MRRYILEGLTLIVAAVLCATVANALASRERKMALVGSYPNALKVPPGGAEPSTTDTTSAAPVAPQPVGTVSAAPTPTAASTTIPPAIAAPNPASAVTTSTAPTKTPPPSAPSKTASTTTSRPGAPATAIPVKPATATVASTATAPPSATPTAGTRPDVSRFQPHPDKPFTEIGYDDVAALHAAGALFLDARRTSVYEQGHIPGARPYSVWESDIDQKVNQLFNERSDPRDQNKPIVAYCSGGECEDSHMLAQKLWGIQFNNVYVYKDGFPDWQKRGGAVHTGANP